MEETKREAMYKGRRASDLTREELLEAYERACAELDRMRQSQMQDAEMERLFADTRRSMLAR